MKTKTLLYLLVAIFIIGGLTAWRLKTPRFTTETSSSYSDKIRKISTSALSSIVIVRGDKTVTFDKKESGWQVNQKNANATKVEELINGMITSARPEVVARTNTRHQEFDVASSSATRVTFDKGLTVIVGKASLSGGTYVRLDGEDTVYSLPTLDGIMTSADANDWYDKTIGKWSETAITKIAIQKPQESFTLLHENDKWLLENGKKDVNREKIASILATLGSFTAKELPEKETIDTYPLRPEATVTIETKDGKETLSFYAPSKGDNYLVKRGKDGVQFLIDSFTAQYFLIPVKNLTVAT